MRTIKLAIQDNQIDRIYHIADVHIRNVKRHKEYEQVFNRLYRYIKKTRTPNSVIYLAGDIVHAKTDMSPELVHQVSNFFRNCADLAPTILITGNHDCNLNNPSRLDALEPIVNAINHTNFHYFKETGVYHAGGVHFNVMSVFDKPADFIRADQFDGDIKIALHHGAVNNASTDAGFMLSNTHVTLDMFKGHDLTLLGDIHKTQFLDDDATIAYAGSLIQQNHGEALGHGILVWDLKTKTSEYVEIENDFGYYTFEINQGKIVNDSDRVPKRPRLRLKVSDTDSAVLKQLIADLKSKYKIQEVSVQRVNALNNIDPNQKISFGNVREVEWQNRAITNFLTDKFALDDAMLDTVRYINRTVHSKLTDTELTRNVTWIPKRFEFSNMFSYGPDNEIDFENLNGSYGLFAPNASGKSTLLDALAFCCFDKCSRTAKAIHVLNNKRISFTCKFQFDLDGKTYFIERHGKKNNRGHVKVDVNFWRIDDTGEVIMLNGEQRDETNKIIREYLGSYDDFVLTALSLQNNNTGFIDKSQRERKELLSQFLDIDVFERQLQIAMEDIRDTSALIREYKRQDYSQVLSDSEKMIQQLQQPMADLKMEKEDHANMIVALNDIIINLNKELRVIDSSLQDPYILESRIKTLQAKETELQTLLSHDKTLLATIVNDIQDKQIKITSIPINTIKDQLTDLTMLQRDRESTVSKLQLKQMEIDHAEKMSDKLEKHKWDPNCEYCMANPWLQETKHIADRLDVFRDDYAIIFNHIVEIDGKIAELESLNLLASETAYATHQREFSDLQIKEAQQITVSLQNENAIKRCVDGISELQNELVKSLTQIDDVKFNKRKQIEINEHQLELSALQSEMQNIDDRVMTIYGKLQVAQKNKDDAYQVIDRLKELERQYKGYEYYLEAVKRNGVPYQLITEALPKIEAEINNILNQVVDFVVTLETDGKNINGYIVYDNDNYWPLELTSGMEKFISSLAIRASLINITSLPRPNFLAIDEGFGVLDSDNLNSMYLLFDYLKSQFGFIMCISHIDAMRDIVDKLIEIKKVNGYSQINYT
jgi:DNA repair exonuclease SbcCD ATPase subunit